MRKILLFLTCFLSLALFSYGQGTDGFFKSENEYVRANDNSDASLTITTENFNDVCVGEGVAVLGILAVCYLIIHNKKKRGLLSVLIPIMFLCSCAKNTTVFNIEEDYVDVSFASNNRSNITGLGEVTFEDGDLLYVFSDVDGGKYLGKLTCSYIGNQYRFSGSLHTWKTDERLSFWYVGENSVNSDGTITIDFSNQTIGNSVSNLKNLANRFHIGVCRIVAPDDAVTTNFNGTLHNMMSIAVFNTQSFDDGTNVKLVGIRGLKNCVHINLNGDVEYCVAGLNNDVDTQNGHILINGGEEHYYVALLPCDETQSAEVELYATSNECVSTGTLSFTIGTNQFFNLGYNGEYAVGYDIPSTSCETSQYIGFPSPEECVNNVHRFTVYSKSNDVKRVVFSQGNLVYDGGRFKQHRYPWQSCPIQNNSTFQVNGTFDRFGWATSCYTFGQTIYEPYSCSTTQYSESKGYGYGIPNSNYRQSFHPDAVYRKQDWGWYQFGMNVYNEYTLANGYTTYWRTMGQQEWTYLFNTRTTASTNLIDGATHNQVSNARYVKATIEGVGGVILFPDDYTHPSDGCTLSYINSSGNNGLTANVLTATDLYGTDVKGGLSAAGAVFIPFLGYYDKISESIIGNDACYWTCKTQSSDGAFYFRMSENIISSSTVMERYQGLNVRLVFQVEGTVF